MCKTLLTNKESGEKSKKSSLIFHYLPPSEIKTEVLKVARLCQSLLSYCKQNECECVRPGFKSNSSITNMMNHSKSVSYLKLGNDNCKFVRWSWEDAHQAFQCVVCTYQRSVGEEFWACVCTQAINILFSHLINSVLFSFQFLGQLKNPVSAIRLSGKIQRTDLLDPPSKQLYTTTIADERHRLTIYKKKGSLQKAHS